MRSFITWLTALALAVAPVTVFAADSRSNECVARATLDAHSPTVIFKYDRSCPTPTLNITMTQKDESGWAEWTIDWGSRMFFLKDVLVTYVVPYIPAAVTIFTAAGGAPAPM